MSRMPRSLIGYATHYSILLCVVIVHEYPSSVWLLTKWRPLLRFRIVCEEGLEKVVND